MEKVASQIEQNLYEYACYLQNSLLFSEELQNIRNQGEFQQFLAGDLMKIRGNEYFRDNQIKLAIQEYEKAISLYHYLENVNVKNKKKGQIKSVYQEVTIPGNDEVVQLKLSLYLNLALCYYKEQLYKDCRIVCEQALKIDSNNIKALFRNAKALTQLDQDNDAKRLVNYEEALQIFKKIYAIDSPKLGSQIDQEYQQISKECKQVRQKMHEKFEKDLKADNEVKQKDQKVIKDKDIKVVKEKESNVVNQKDQKDVKEKVQKDIKDKTVRETRFVKPSEKFDNYDYEFSYEVNENIQVPPEIIYLGEILNKKGQELIEKYSQLGQFNKAANLADKLKRAQKAKMQLEKISKLDFKRPSKKLQEIATKHNINLLEPQIREHFMNIQKQNIEDIKAWVSRIEDGGFNFGIERDKTPPKSFEMSTESLIQGLQNAQKNTPQQNNFSFKNSNQKQTSSQAQSTKENINFKLEGNSFIINNNYYQNQSINDIKIQNNINVNQDQTAKEQKNQEKGFVSYFQKFFLQRQSQAMERRPVN